MPIDAGPAGWNLQDMPVHFTIDHDRRSMQVRADGDVGLKDVEAFLDSLVVESALPYRKFIDTRNATAVYVTADVVQLAARMKLYSHVDRRGAVAVVVNPQHRDLIEHFLELGRPQRPARCFLDPSEAATWLQQQRDA